MYQTYQTMFGQMFILHLQKQSHIPVSSDNTDYQQFKKDLANGVELKDAEGNQMTPEQITTFLATLP